MEKGDKAKNKNKGKGKAKLKLEDENVSLFYFCSFVCFFLVPSLVTVVNCLSFIYLFIRSFFVLAILRLRGRL